MSEVSPPIPPAIPKGAPTRRALFGRLTAAAGAAAALALGVPLVGYFLGPLRRRPVRWVRLGRVDEFPVGQTRKTLFDNPLREPWDGMTAQTSAYVRYLGPDGDGREQFWVFAVNCTHLGCPVTWFPESGLFMCPCHGGVYYENGERASGPPPRGLYRYPWRVRGGVLEIQAPHLPTLQDPLERRDQIVQLGVSRCRPGAAV